MMNEFERIRQISEKMQHLLGTVSKNGGRFSAIDKDLLSGYVRELYELAVSIQPSSSVSSQIPSITPPQEPLKKVEIPPVIEEQESEKHKQNGVKRSITEIYADRNTNGKSSVNDRFKKQSPEIADKLKQTPIRDLKAYIGLNKRFAFIETLFSDREEEYENAIAKVNGFKSYEEAVNYIRSDVLPKFEWSDDEPLVNEFFTLVMRRYLK